MAAPANQSARNTSWRRVAVLLSLITVLHRALGYGGGPDYKNAFVRPTGGTCSNANGANSDFEYDSDGFATDTDGNGCYYNCSKVDGACDDITSSDCCLFYPENVYTDVHELNDLANFAEVCDHASWDHNDHLLNWCHGQNVSEYFSYDSGFGTHTYQSGCTTHFVTDPCEGTVITKPVTYTLKSWMTDSNLKWDGLTCDDEDGGDNEYGNGIENIIEIDLSAHAMYCPLGNTNMSALTYLEELDLSQNALYGRLPEWPGHMRSLTTLRLFQNRITGSLPDGWHGAFVLSEIEIYQNQITGTIPSAWFQTMSSGSCTGASDTHMSKLTQFLASNNSITGPLPAGVACSDLTDLDLSHNKFHSDFPDFQYFTLLQQLKLNGNVPGFTGSLPSTIGDATLLEYLDISGNNMTGTLPSNLASLASLTTLKVNDNLMHGYIPSLPSSLSTVDFSGGKNDWWCPFPNHDAIFRSISCTCTRGHYCPSNAGGQNCEYNCTKCAVGTAQPDTWQPTCDDCAAGKYGNATGLHECTDCKRGTYNNQVKQNVCTDCRAGRFVNETGQTNCTDCRAGHYTAKVGAETCDKCSLGFYQPSKGQTACDSECGAGYVASKDMSKCEGCGVGKAATGTASTRSNLCTNCTTGRYQDEEAQETCEACTNNQIAPREGMSSCYDCPAGSHSHSAEECLLCLPGEYAGSSGMAECDPCEPGGVSDEGAVACTGCPTGKHWMNLSQYKTPEYSGSDLVSGGWNLTCVNCSAGRIAPTTGMTACDKCARGKYNDQTGRVNCKTCAPGEKADALGLTACTVCGAGKHSVWDHSRCDMCDPGTYAVGTGNTNCTDCAKGTYNDKNGSSVPCGACGAGTYQDQLGQSSCVNCPQPASNRSDYFTIAPGTGAVQCNATPAGYYFVSANRSAEPCAAGYYSTIGVKTCSMCSAGSYSAATSSSCTVCPGGKYQDEDAASACKDLPGGYASSSEGLTAYTEATRCHKGKYANTSGSLTCSTAEKGYYVPSSSSGQSHQRPCPVGYYSDTEGASSCTACPAGQYADNRASTSCIMCGRCRFADDKGTESCAYVPPGAETNANHTAYSVCPTGYYSNSTCSCMECPKNYYSDTEESVECTPCASGYHTEGTGSSICVLKDSDDSVNDDCSGPLCGVTENTPLNTAAATSVVGAAGLLLLCGISWGAVKMYKTKNKQRNTMLLKPQKELSERLRGLEMVDGDDLMMAGNPATPPPPPPMQKPASFIERASSWRGDRSSASSMPVESTSPISNPIGEADDRVSYDFGSGSDGSLVVAPPPDDRVSYDFATGESSGPGFPPSSTVAKPSGSTRESVEFDLSAGDTGMVAPPPPPPDEDGHDVETGGEEDAWPPAPPAQTL